MRALLAFAAAVGAAAIPAAPVQAEEGLTFVTGGSGFHGGHGRIDRRRVRGHGGDVFLGDWEYTGNQAWRSNSFNDWWHDSPDRAYPRWMQNNGNCQRQWWGADTLRC